MSFLLIAFSLFAVLAALSFLQPRRCQRPTARAEIRVFKTIWDNEGLVMPGYLVLAGAKPLAFVPNINDESEHVARGIARTPSRVNRRFHNNFIIFDLSATRITDKSNAGFIGQIMYPIALRGRPLDDWVASEFAIDKSLGQMVLRSYSAEGLATRLQTQTQTQQQTEQEPIGNIWAGDGWGQVRPGYEMNVEGFTVATAPEGLEQVPSAPQAA